MATDQGHDNDQPISTIEDLLPEEVSFLHVALANQMEDALRDLLRLAEDAGIPSGLNAMVKAKAVLGRLG